MKKLTLVFVLTFGVMVMAQETANRFVYELAYKPKKDSTELEKELMALDITKSKSIYRDYISVSQDSIIKDMVEKAKKATTEFGGRTWTAWFSRDLPFQDGPYKFSGLPGLIVKIEDDGKNYSWVLQANKKISNYEEQTYGEKMMNMAAPTDVSKEKFEKTFNGFEYPFICLIL